MRRRTPTDAVEAGLDAGEAGVDRWLELVVGEDVGPVALDALAHQFADVERIDAALDALANVSDGDEALSVVNLPNSLPALLLTQPEASWPIRFIDQNPTNALPTGQSRSLIYALIR